MHESYVYLSWTGWIWFIIAGTFLIVKLKSKRANSTEAKQPNEQ